MKKNKLIFSCITALITMLLMQGCNKKDDYILFTHQSRVSITGLYVSDKPVYPMLNGFHITFGREQSLDSPIIDFNGMVQNDDNLEEFVFTLHDAETDKEVYRAIAKKEEDGIYRTPDFTYIRGKLYDNLDDYKYTITQGMVINMSSSDILVKSDMPGMDGQNSGLEIDETGAVIIPAMEPYNGLGTYKDYYGKTDYSKEFTFTVIDRNSGKTLGTRKYKIGDFTDYKDNIHEYRGNELNIVVVDDASGQPYLLTPPAVQAKPNINQVGFYLINEQDPSSKEPYDLVYAEDETIRFDNLIPGQWEVRDASTSIDDYIGMLLRNSGTTDPYLGMEEWQAQMYSKMLSFGNETGKAKWFLITISEWGVNVMEM